MAGHAQLKFVMTECSKTQIRLTRPPKPRESLNTIPLLCYSIDILFVILSRSQRLSHGFQVPSQAQVCISCIILAT